MTNQDWRDIDLDGIAESVDRDRTGIRMQEAGVAFERLQTKAMRDAAEAQIGAALDQKVAAEAAVRAAEAAENTAEYTRNTAWWMMWSVIVLAASSVLTLIATMWLRH